MMDEKEKEGFRYQLDNLISFLRAFQETKREIPNSSLDTLNTIMKIALDVNRGGRLNDSGLDAVKAVYVAVSGGQQPHEEKVVKVIEYCGFVKIYLDQPERGRFLED